jgi:putative permease
VIILALMLAGLFAGIMLFGEILAPAMAALVLAYVLEGVVLRLVRLGLPRLAAVSLVSVLFTALCALLFFGVLPLLTRQITQLVRDLPGMLTRGQEYLLLLPQQYPKLFSQSQIQTLLGNINHELLSLGHTIVSVSLANVADVFTFLAYLVLVPMLVFFGLKDKVLILAWCRRFLPERRDLTERVWQDVDAKMGSYIRGKIIEIVIVWLVSYCAFAVLGLEYAMLLAFLVGISVIIPYVGFFVVTVPVIMVGYFQWGMSPEFGWLMVVYLAIQAMDAFVLMPVLFAEVVNLHPVAIIIAILFFGGLWGLWGVFFAIPLATVVDTVLTAWPRRDDTPVGHGLP